jgi:hypothetical protein
MRESYLFRIIWGELYENYTTGQIFLSNYYYQGLQNSHVNLYEYFLKFELKSELL